MSIVCISVDQFIPRALTFSCRCLRKNATIYGMIRIRAAYGMFRVRAESILPIVRAAYGMYPFREFYGTLIGMANKPLKSNHGLSI